MGDSEHDDDPFETYIGTDRDDDVDDYPARSWSWPRGVFTRQAWAITAVILATASLLGIVSTELISDAITYSAPSPNDRAVAPAIQAGFAALAIVFGGLALRPDRDDETATWPRAVAVAAVIVGILSVILNLVAVAALLSATDI